jgi:hypothetical protein
LEKSIIPPPDLLDHLLLDGNLVPSFEAVDLNSRSIVRVRLSETDCVFFFTPLCPECALNDYITSLRLPKEKHTSLDRCMLIFSSRFPTSALRQVLASSGLRARAAQATEGIPLIDRPYRNNIIAPAPVILATASARGMIRFSPFEREPSLGSPALQADPMFSNVIP